MWLSEKLRANVVELRVVGNDNRLSGGGRTKLKATALRRGQEDGEAIGRRMLGDEGGQ